MFLARWGLIYFLFKAHPISWHELPGFLHEFGRLGHQRQFDSENKRVRQFFGMGGRPLQTCLQSWFGRSEKTLFGMGHEEHQQPQRAHPQKKLFGSPCLFVAMHVGERRSSPPKTGDLRQSAKKTARYSDSLQICLFYIIFLNLLV